jgi:hypothetical protein
MHDALAIAGRWHADRVTGVAFFATPKSKRFPNSALCKDSSRHAAFR